MGPMMVRNLLLMNRISPHRVVMILKRLLKAMVQCLKLILTQCTCNAYSRVSVPWDLFWIIENFSVAYLQHLICSAWCLQGTIIVVGRDSLFYMIHFDDVEDLEHMCSEGPWFVDGALLVLEKWRPNLVMSKLHLNFVSIWVQLHGLPLEYQDPELADRMG